MTEATQNNGDTTVTRLTDAIVKQAKPPRRGYQRIREQEIKGLFLRVTSSGFKSFVLDYRLDGTRKSHTIGKYGVYPVAAARDEAKKLLQDVARGIDPQAERKERRDQLTVRHLYERVWKHRWSAKAPQYQRDIKHYFEKHILPAIGKKKIDAVTVEDVQSLKTAYPRQYAANRMLTALGTAYNDARRWELITRNPVDAVQRNKEHVKVHYFTKEELARLLIALDQSQEQTATMAIRLMIFTGCRVGEALKAMVPDFTDDFKVWITGGDRTKQSKIHCRKLPDDLASRLRQFAETREYESGPWLFASKNGGHIATPRKTWKTACKRAGLGDRQLKSLRDSFASNMANIGYSLQMIGEALGHSNVSTTARYAHLFSESTERVINAHAASLHAALLDESFTRH